MTKINTKKLWYLASPYTRKYKGEGGPQKAYVDALNICVKLMRETYQIYSPIVHSHPINEIHAFDYEVYLKMDEKLARSCDGLLLCPGWDHSLGCLREIEWFRKAKKPIFMLNSEEDPLPLKKWTPKMLE
jgi:hypothetical protein